jgi:hypothetical protein
MITRLTTMRDLAFIVCTELERQGIQAVLVGGAAAHIYAPNEYVSHDLDLVLSIWSEDRSAREVLQKLGFESDGRNMKHDQSPFTIEFPPGPLAVGEEVIRNWDTIREDDRLMHILTPTDCVRDRLAGYLFWHDRQSLAAAVAVAKAHPESVVLKIVEKLCEIEGEKEKFKDFARALDRS